MLVINCKNYEEVARPADLVRLARAAHAASKKHKIRVAVAPPPHMAALLARSSPCTVLAQHADAAEAGSTTGHMVPELLAKSGIAGCMINHSEHRVPFAHSRQVIARARALRMISVMCVKDIAEARRAARLGPTYVAIEPPELIGSGRSVSTHRPGLVSGAAKAVKSAGNRTRMLCGAGIASGQDVAAARKLGSKGVLVASGVIRAKSWPAAISELASSV